MTNRSFAKTTGLVSPSYMCTDHTPLNTESKSSGLHVPFHAVHLKESGATAIPNSPTRALKDTDVTDLPEAAKQSRAWNLDVAQFLLSPK